MFKNKSKLYLLGFVFLAGCAATPPTAEQLAQADYGAYPKNWQSQIKQRLEMVLVDPESVKYRFNYPDPARGWQDVMGDKGGFSSKRIYGWKACFQYNAKNRMGGYAGYQDAYAFFQNGQIALFDTKYGDVNCAKL